MQAVHKDGCSLFVVIGPLNISNVAGHQMAFRQIPENYENVMLKWHNLRPHEDTCLSRPAVRHGAAMKTH